MSINTTYSGIINIDKPRGFTSHDVISKMRGIAQMKRIGHAGTLDPMATGVLLVMLGNATRLMEYAHDLKKTYRAEITLGATSDTDDAMGVITESDVTELPEKSAIQKVIPQFLGNIEQIPPAYAAIKVKGKKLYEYARKNQIVERKPRPVTIYDIEILSYNYPYLDIRVTCGSGTYIRSLARDIGEEIKTGAYLSKLKREAIGDFVIDNATDLNELTPNNISGHIIDAKKLVTHLPSITLSSEEIQKIQQGQPITPRRKDPLRDTALALFREDRSLLGIGIFHSDTKLIHPKKILI